MSDAERAMRIAREMCDRFSRGELFREHEAKMLTWSSGYAPEQQKTCVCGAVAHYTLQDAARYAVWRILNERPGRSLRFKLTICRVTSTWHVGRS